MVATYLNNFELTETCFKEQEKWVNDPECGISNPLYVPATFNLIHSEITEAAEGHRKDKMDDHLPHRKAVEVELADALIRIYGLAGALDLDVGSAMEEKIIYNRTRADHRDGSKKY